MEIIETTLITETLMFKKHINAYGVTRFWKNIVTDRCVGSHSGQFVRIFLFKTNY